MPSAQVDFADAGTFGGFYVFEKSADLSIEPDADETSKDTLDPPPLLPKARSKRRLSCTGEDASQRGGFWEYQLDSLDDPEGPVKEVPANSASWAERTNEVVEQCTHAPSKLSDFLEEPSSPQQQRHRHSMTTSTGWDTISVKQSVGSLAQRKDESVNQGDSSGEAGKAQDEDNNNRKSNHPVETSTSSNNIRNKDSAGTSTKSRQKSLHKSRKSGSKSRSKSSMQFHVITPSLAPVEEVYLEDDGVVQFCAHDRKYHAGKVVEHDNANVEEVVSEQVHEATQDVTASKYLLKSEEPTLSAAEADRASLEAHVELCDEQERVALKADISRMDQIESNGTYFFADESLGWYGVGYGSYVTDRPNIRKRVEFYHILYHRGIIETLPQISTA
eukprot:CAMPEP_0114257998 /NCGR_PEP_ID=MMETSP0058-20121206/19057_1 /TAXON_ID=36894 /ORGANISM="Pyramimonas parkeae, CCMP726" /LENGTH=388 /DNA_ID=CAMNT_0001372813 /DNA_START=314 /DNA_END=1480 /DNA_ORIENTATION=+